MLPVNFAQRPLHSPVDIIDFITETVLFKLHTTFAEDVNIVLFLWLEEINGVTLHVLLESLIFL